ncbi:ATP-binding cassette domain-containing protein [Amycolatopsis sp. 195334CR]|uniref:ATP-binding cassette domain-containing protein n=1 Tax=Amycolatopsis sp. 195334CR TaxID=2814588 RepID=UPI001A8D005F|nr:ABC transporter ATP-binding protein [Amycolatopsis sp. 195334CR]MBN6039200.1 ABC transporter ATP-binding protein [Amycolatopsis sp. 195334CR]
MSAVVDRTGTAIEVDRLGKDFRGGRGRVTHALRDCSFELPAGKVAALVGANGAGKTTLLTVLAGLRQAGTGKVVVTGRASFVAQDKPVYRHLTALDMLAVGARLNLVWDQDRARSWLDRFRVPLDRPCGRLSGGERSQVAFAVALGSRPDVLLLDEPLSELDPVVRREMMAELLVGVAATGMTVVLSTHVVGELSGVADHLLLLSVGRLVLAGELDDLLARHVRYTGPRADAPPGPGVVLEAAHHTRQSSFLVELPGGAPRGSAEPWTVRPVNVEELVLARLARRVE